MAACYSSLASATSSSAIAARRRVILARGAAGVATAMPNARATTAVASERYSKGLLWRVSRAGTRDSFCFGTIHIADARVAAIPAAVEAALDRSRTFAAELDLAGVADPRAAELEQLEDGRRLESLLSSATYAALRAEVARRGMSIAAIERAKPWAALFALGSRRDATMTVEPLDRRLAAAARTRKLKPMALEWIDEQVAAFDSIPMASQVALLEHALAHPDYLDRFIEPTIRAWLARDLAALAAVNDAIGRAYPPIATAQRDLERAIIRDRNALIHHRLALPLRSGALFVAVGAMHLPGPHGLLAAVAGDGYKMERLW